MMVVIGIAADGFAAKRQGGSSPQAGWHDRPGLSRINGEQRSPEDAERMNLQPEQHYWSRC
jgi:hypothetical protein